MPILQLTALFRLMRYPEPEVIIEALMPMLASNFFQMSRIISSLATVCSPASVKAPAILSTRSVIPPSSSPMWDGRFPAFRITPGPTTADP